MLAPALSAQAPASTATAKSNKVDSEVVTLSAFEVLANDDDGYVSSNIISGSRIREAIKDTPLNISVITEEMMRDLKADTLNNVLEYTTGVNVEEERNMSFQVRGYRVWVPRRNGFRVGLPYGQTQNVERVEFVRGPASVLYGEADPGGIINTITKRPRPKERTSISATVGSWDYFRSDVDWNKPLSAKHGLYARLNLSYRYNKTWVNFEENESTLIAPSLLWKVSPQTAVYADFEYVNSHRNPPGLLPRYSDPAATSPFADEMVNFWNNTTKSYEARRLGTAYPTNRFFTYRLAVTDRSFNFNGPLSMSDGEANVGQIEITHQFTDNLQTRIGYNYAERNDKEYRFGSSTFRNENGFFAANNINASQAYLQNGRSIGIMSDGRIRGYSLQGDLVWDKKVGKIDNKLLIFAERSVSRDTSMRYNANALPVADRLPAPANLSLNPNTPLVYNDPPYSPEKFVLNNDSKGKTRAFAITDQVALFNKRLRLMAGARYQKTGVAVTQSRWTPQYGATFGLTESINLYGLISQAYTQQFQRRPEDNEFADPVLGEGKEIGLKFDALQGRVSGMIALYETLRLNQWGTIPLDTPIPTQSDPTRRSVYRDEKSKGIEADLVLSPTKNWQVIAGYAYTDSMVSSNPSEQDPVAVNWPSVIGLPLANTPEHRFNLWNRYNFTTGKLKGLYVGGGVVFTGERLAQVDGRTLFWTLPEYTKIDLLGGYRHRVGKLQVDYSFRLENVFDEYYVQSQNGFGAPRNFKFTVRTSF